MDPLWPDDPRTIGPYRLIARFDPAQGGPPLPERRFVGRGPGGDRTVLLGVPLAADDAGRFAVEAEAARRLSGRWLSPVAEVGGGDGPPWYATPYLPAVSLTTALAAHGGPLPEHTVRALGAALAEALAGLHAQGLAHGGISPGAVLLTADGPRLGCFGAVRVAAPDGERRSGHPGLAFGSVPPEQLTGGRPRPLGDSYALGSVLAYAATGQLVPERGELPEGLRTLVSRCRTRDPVARPRAGELLAELAGTAAGAPRSPGQPSHGTVLDGANSLAGALLGPGWLPGRVIAALARQSAEVLAAETEPEAGAWAGA
ncbi:serine/threonine protein kinase [Streptomyces palmae]|uniref:Serine/threonine protein kinase n=1 Tax=Streptomyces palmae TaxID=1701085 RepID=A0A4Z0G0Q7_9ACTN|nr:serine/threonine protein kinase [Streptomyces palmae]TGA87788.1 serine/threonine protein kinase [Streptomyces palmae]